MQPIRSLRLPTGLTITLGCGWPDAARVGPGRCPGDTGAQERHGARMRAQAEARTGTEDIENRRGADRMRAVGRKADAKGRGGCRGTGDGGGDGVPGAGMALQPAEQQGEEAQQQGIQRRQAGPTRAHGGVQAGKPVGQGGGEG